MATTPPPEPDPRRPGYVRRSLLAIVLLCAALVGAVVAMEPPADDRPPNRFPAGASATVP
jgi:hypothetical protein